MENSNFSADQKSPSLPTGESSLSPETETGSSGRRAGLYVGAGVLILLIAGGIWAFFNYKKEQPAVTIPPVVLQAQNIGKPSAGLKEIYLSWARALQSGQIESTYAYFTKKSAQTIQNQLAKLDSPKRQQLVELMKSVAPQSEAEVGFGAEAAEADKGILRIETTSTSSNKYSRVKKPRSYGTIFFVKEDGNWKIARQSFVEYKDPTPLIVEDPVNPITFFWYAQFHANHTSSPAACAAEATWGAQCYRSWAVLNRDAKLCGQISSAAFGGSERANCYTDLTLLTGDPALCAQTSSADTCRNSVSDSAYLAYTNIYTIDSDQDGLTDLQESYFNTSIVKADTDGDGTEDGTEVKNDTNPLGKGKLGDHLIK